MPTLAPEDDTVGALPDQTFHPFPRLPLELRQEIWKLAVPLTMNGPSVCRIGEVPIFWGDIGKLTVDENSSLKLVCREARQAVIQGPPVRRVYDPLIDFLYFEDDMLYFHFTSKASVDDLARVKRVALALPIVSRSDLRKSLGLFQLKGLEELSIVYPKETGKIEHFYDVYLPETGPRMLRRLTEKEMSRFVIEWNFEYYSLNGHVWTNLERDARGHLDYIRWELSQWMDDGRPPCWDEEKRELKLKMHALCFDEDGDEMF